MMVKIRELEGREHYVAPMVMITEGVHHGSSGPLYYPGELLERTAHLWNGRPVVVFHPSMYSDSFAGNPRVFNRQKIGTVFNCRYVQRQLKAEAWIDKARAAALDWRIVETLEAGRMMEVSTGLYTGLEERMGTFNGKHYDRSVNSIVPDHLAILPEGKGACSIADGAGLCRNDAYREEVLGMPVWV